MFETSWREEGVWNQDRPKASLLVYVFVWLLVDHLCFSALGANSVSYCCMEPFSTLKGTQTGAVSTNAAHTCLNTNKHKYTYRMLPNTVDIDRYADWITDEARK